MKNEEKYMQFCLVQEMMDTSDIIRNFKLENMDELINVIKAKSKLFFTGEGSSRIFPAKNAIYTSMRAGYDINLATDGGRQAAEYNLSDFVVFGASNSGSTKEVIALFDRLDKVGIDDRFGLTAREDTKLSEMSKQTFVLSCGWEQAVAATK